VEKIPFHEVEKLESPKIGVILLLPNRIEKMEAINAFWDATAMFYLKDPRLKKKIEKGDLLIMVSREGEWLTEWDGKNVTQAWCHSPKDLIGSHKIKSLYAMNLSDQSLKALNKGWSHGCIQN
jgi:hypothetical protein